VKDICDDYDSDDRHRRHTDTLLNNNNNNNNVYGAVLMTMVTARVHPVHLMNAY